MQIFQAQKLILTLQKDELDNQQSLYQSGIASEKDYNEAKQNYQKALAAKDKIQSSST